MKKLLFALLAIVIMSCNNTKGSQAAVADTIDSSRVLVAYFSATGTTKAVAEQIAEATNATLYEITPEPRYTEADLDWRDKQSRSSVEMNDEKCRPALGGDSIDVSGYDVVFIGYPIWWDLAPRQVNTFIETYNLADKRIIPFATSGGSEITNSVADLKRLYPSLDWQDGALLNNANPVSWAKEVVK